jgi:hypothetical protein
MGRSLDVRLSIAALATLEIQVKLPCCMHQMGIIIKGVAYRAMEVFRIWLSVTLAVVLKI